MVINHFVQKPTGVIASVKTYSVTICANPKTVKLMDFVLEWDCTVVIRRKTEVKITVKAKMSQSYALCVIVYVNINMH